MVRIEFDGKPFDPSGFEDTLMAAALQQVAANIGERVRTIRDPATGEFPTVVVRATSLSDIQLHVEGSDAMIAKVKEVLGRKNKSDSSSAGDEVGRESLRRGGMAAQVFERVPQVFLSYASDDRGLADRIAHAMQANGINVWWDKWEIRAGDSFRRKIDEGIEGCTHFVVLLTPTSLTKQWVNLEIDAGLVRAMSERARFIPLRSDVSIEQISPLLRGMYSPLLADFDADIRQLVHDIHDITRKPALGPSPNVLVQSATTSTGYSPAATAIARVFVETTRTALDRDPQLSRSKLMERTGLSKDDVKDALHELRHFTKIREYSGGVDIVTALPELYAEFDAYWQPWTPADDALRVASDLVNDPAFPSRPSEIAQRCGWHARRLNPALTYLIERDAIKVRNGIAGGDYPMHGVFATDDTRRFVKSR